jgi:hypothetical protein
LVSQEHRENVLVPFESGCLRLKRFLALSPRQGLLVVAVAGTSIKSLRGQTMASGPKSIAAALKIPDLPTRKELKALDPDVSGMFTSQGMYRPVRDFTPKELEQAQYYDEMRAKAENTVIRLKQNLAATQNATERAELETKLRRAEGGLDFWQGVSRPATDDITGAARRRRIRRSTGTRKGTKRDPKATRKQRKHQRS